MIEIIERSPITTKGFSLNLDAEKKKRNADDITRYPIVYINNVLIQSDGISFLKLNNDAFVPTISLEFSDPTNKLIDDNFPTDNSVISIFKESNNSSTMAIKMDFKVTDFNIIKGTKKETITYTIEGVLDIDGLYLNNFESYKGTSYTQLQKISKELQLGFATNIKNTNDEMVWINPSNYKIEFIKEIISKSYITDETFLFGYIDFYYNFNYVDIETQLKDDISTQMNIMDREKIIKDEKEDSVPLILSNNPDAANSNLYISKYTLYNSSTNINLTYGYRHMAFYYNKSDDNFKKYALDTITTEDGNSIMLKGEPGVTKGLYSDMICNTYMGKLDTDNVHREYLHSALQNRNNLKFLQKLKMTVKIDKPNFGLYRFQKVLVELYNNGKINNKETEEQNYAKDSGPHDTKIINKLSGEWLITAINFTFSKKDGNVQELTLVKRELTSKYNFPRRVKKATESPASPTSEQTQEDMINQSL